MKIVKVLRTNLSSPLGSTDLSLTVAAFVDSKGNAVTLPEFGTNGYYVVVVKQGDTTEIIKCTGITANANGSYTLTIAGTGRNLDPFTPYTAYASGQDFSAGAEVIVTNDPLTMDTFANKDEANSFTQANDFLIVPTSQADPVADNDLTRKSWVQNLLLGTLTTIDVIVPGTAGTTIAAGKLIYFDDPTNVWLLADAGTSAKSENVLLGIAQGAGTLGNPISNGVLLQGVDTHQSGLTIGATYFVGTAGAISASAGTFAVTAGIGKTATQLYFAPRFNQQITQSQMDALAGDTGTPSGTNKFITQQSPFLTPSGAILQYAGLTAPTGWILCDGSAVSRATYATLFGLLNPTVGTPTITLASPGVFSLNSHGLKEGDTVYLTTTGALPTGLAINTLYYVIAAGLTTNAFELSATRGGAAINTSVSQSGVHTLRRTAYGLGDGSTTFNVPNFVGKVGVGRDPADTAFALGETGGEKTHVLTTPEIPAHTHTEKFSAGSRLSNMTAPTTGLAENADGGTTGSTGGGGAHNNLQPYITVNFIIKV